MIWQKQGWFQLNNIDCIIGHCLHYLILFSHTHRFFWHRRQAADELARATAERASGEQAAARLRRQFEEVKTLALAAAEEEQARQLSRGEQEEAVNVDRAEVAQAARTLKADAQAIQAAKVSLTCVYLRQ